MRKFILLDGVPAFCDAPKALQHAFDVVRDSKTKIPLSKKQTWLSRARIETAAIYVNAVGPKERALARRVWY